MNLARDYRCRHCGKLLFKGLLVDSEVEIKCRGCHEFSVFTGENANELICLVENCPGRIKKVFAVKV